MSAAVIISRYKVTDFKLDLQFFFIKIILKKTPKNRKQDWKMRIKVRIWKSVIFTVCKLNVYFIKMNAAIL